MDTILAVGRAILAGIRDGANTTWVALKPIILWPYLPHAFFTSLAFIAAVAFLRAQRKWNRAWLSDRVEHRLHEIEHAQADTKRSLNGKPTARTALRMCRNYSFRLSSALRTYFLRGLWSALGTMHLPTVTSAIALFAILGVVLFLPHHPAGFSAVFHPQLWANVLAADLDEKKDISAVFEGLIVVIVALIVFVAESVRGSRNSDERRVLLKLSFLWPLTVLITMSPLIFLWPPLKGATVLYAIAVTLLAIYGFARVLRNLLDAGASVRAQRIFLMERVRGMILYSVRERIGNKLLQDTLGVGKEIPINFTLSRSWLPNGEQNYVFIEAPGEGTLADLNLYELKSLGELVSQRQRRIDPVTRAAAQTGTTAGPSSRPQNETTDETERKQPFLLRRFKEELPKESAFSRDRSVLAIPREIGADRALMEELTIRAKHVFKFTREESPSSMFQREMQSTKDRLISAIRDSALGSISELQQTYLTVAEVFLTVLVELGGGYTAEQAREERSNWFQGWSEIRWLTRDVRELLVAAAATDNTDVIGTIAFLPYAIATRAYLAGDNLLFQEFLNFGSFIYSLGAEKPVSSPAKHYLIDRSWRYLAELARYQVQPSFAKGADDE